MGWAIVKPKHVVSFEKAPRRRLSSNPRPPADGAPAPAQTALDPAVAVREVAKYPAHLVPGLPEPPTLGFDGFHVSLDPHVYATLRGSGVIVLTGDEWLALVVAAEAGRASPAVLAKLLAQKRQSPAWELDQRAALGHGVQPGEPPRRRWTVGGVARAWGTKLRTAVC